MTELTLHWLQRSHNFFLTRTQRFALLPGTYALLLALLTTVLFCAPFAVQVQQKIPAQYALQALLLLVLLLLNSFVYVLLSLPGFPRLQRSLLSGFFLIAAISHYFISHFGTVIDREMLQNVLETDIAEASGLLNPDLIFTTAGWLLLLGWLNLKIEFKPMSRRRSAAQWLLTLLLLFSGIGAVAATQYAELASFFRNYRDVKFFALPISPLSASISVTKQQIAAHFPPTFQLLGTDVRNLAPTAAPKTVVLVLGETARADHFQLNGYSRPTNPRLSQLPVISFSQVSSCGTATAHSVPCMFSWMGRERYDETAAKNSSNVLDILQSSGVDVSWYDNNSGCKGVCDRVKHQMLFESPECKSDGCTDAILLQALQRELAQPASKDRIIVLHQLGSHGPEYSRRSTAQQKVFGPECTDKELNHCPPQHIINAYDNSLLATDALLASVIGELQHLPDSAMLYISDHGESLGENGVYLHGLPYWMAPKAQTGVPLIWWMSQSFGQHFNPANGQRLSFDCLKQQQKQPLSHDHLFHSLPALFARDSADFRPELNLFAACSRR
jgi:lipid A ethanolaminephosphotransferase